jgi:tetratricopeptide (TPR) repeat protein
MKVYLFLFVFSMLNTSVCLGQKKTVLPYEIGMECFGKGDYICAIAFLGAAISQDNKNLLAYYNRGVAYLKQGIQYDMAVRDFTEVINRSPFHFPSYVNRAAAKKELQDFEGTYLDCDFVIDAGEFAPKEQRFYAYAIRGDCNRERGRYSEAIIDYTNAIELNPKSSSTYYFRGVVNIAYGNRKAGCLDLSKSGELGDSHSYSLIRQHCQ